MIALRGERRSKRIASMWIRLCNDLVYFGELRSFGCPRLEWWLARGRIARPCEFPTSPSRTQPANARLPGQLARIENRENTEVSLTGGATIEIRGFVPCRQANAARIFFGNFSQERVDSKRKSS
jgi:hypothetical protein